MSGRRSLVLVTCALAACSSTSHMPAPASPEASGVAIYVKIRAPVRIVTKKAEQVLFVRLAGPDSSVVEGEPIPSNCLQDGYAILLNAPPGTYVAVAGFDEMEPVPNAPPDPSFGGTVALSGHSSVSVSYSPFRPGPTNYTTYFSEDMIRQTAVTVSAGQVAFMGDFVVDQSVGLKGADPTQQHFAKQLGGDESMVSDIFEKSYHYRGELHDVARSAATEADFRKAVSGKLVEVGWSAMPEH